MGESLSGAMIRVQWGFPGLITFAGAEAVHTRLGIAVALQLAAGVWLYHVARRAGLGVPRLLASLPAIVALCAIAGLFSWEQPELLYRVSFIFTCGWLGTFKVLWH
jgi:hypothetical protein